MYLLSLSLPVLLLHNLHSMAEEEANWLDLPDHILELIIDKLNLNFFDYIRFGATCVSWRSLILDHSPKQFPPFLLIPTPDDNDESTTKKKINKKKHKTKSRSFYSISDNKVCNQYCQVRMPRYRQCRGSSHDGWMITVDDMCTSYSIRLFNPLLSHEILLPPLETFPNYPGDTIRSYTCLQKAVLSADPLLNPDDYTVLAIYGPDSMLAFYKPGDKAWSPILHCKPDGIKGWSIFRHPRGFHDTMYYKGRLLAIRDDGIVVVCHPETRTATRVFSGPEEEDKGSKKYLAHTSNEVLMQVHRSFNVDHSNMDRRGYTCSTTGFRVYKLGNVNNKWEPVKSLGEYALFIGGENDCISISTSDYPRSLIMPNCIYYLYMEDPYHCPNDMGVYNLEDGSFERHYHLPGGISSIYPVPIWIQPSLTKKRQQQ